MREELKCLVEYAKSRLEPILQREGAILYTSAETLKHGDFYVLGLNPGGDPGQSASDRREIGLSTVEQALSELATRKTNAYEDEQWANGRGGIYPRAQHPLQRNLCWLVAQLGSGIADVCASNLIFVTSQSAEGSGYPQLAELCWPVHERILEIVQPRMILTFGNGHISPFRWLRQNIENGDCGEQHLDSVRNAPSGHGTWTVKAFRRTIAGRSVTVVGLPHLSRANIRNDDVVAWIRALLA